MARQTERVECTADAEGERREGDYDPYWKRPRTKKNGAKKVRRKKKARK